MICNNELPFEFNVQIKRSSENEWNNIVNLFEDATVYQTWAYGAVRWGEKNLSHIVLIKDGNTVAAAQVRLLRLPLVNRGIAYISWGPLWRKKGLAKNMDILRYMAMALRKEYTIRRGFIMRVRPGDIDNCVDNIATIWQQVGFTLRKDLPRYHTLLLDIKPPLEFIRKNLNQKWRNQLNRAERNGLQILEGSDEKLYDMYCAIHKDLLERKGYIGEADLEEYRKIQQMLPEGQKLHIMIAVDQGKPVCGIVNSIVGDTGIYVLGATNVDGQNSKSSYLLQWRMIVLLKELGASYYDLGGINPIINRGVFHFKSGITKNQIFHIGQYETTPNNLKTLIIQSVERLFTYFRQIKRRKRTIGTTH